MILFDVKRALIPLRRRLHFNAALYRKGRFRVSRYSIERLQIKDLGDYPADGKDDIWVGPCLSRKGQIESQATFADFVFSMKCKTNSDGLNSGVFFRCIPGDVMNGYESQIQNQFKNEDRAAPVDCGTGGIFRRIDARRVNADDQNWFSKTIIANGPRIAVWVNGLQVTDWSVQRKPDANPRRGQRLEAGSIIFQGHDPTTDILLKDINARELKSRK